MWKGADSRRFVSAAVLEMLSVRKLKVGNADITLLAQTPKAFALPARYPSLAGADARRHREPGEHQGHDHRTPGIHRPQRRVSRRRPSCCWSRHESRMIPEHWRRAALAPPAAWGAALGTGVLRTTPEDFEVEEILGFAAGGEGPHALLRVRKRGANTEWVARELARAAGVQALRSGLRRNQGSQCGHHPVLHGAARQARRRGVRRTQRRGLRGSESAAHQRKLPRGALEGNRFRHHSARPHLRTAALARARISVLAAGGAPNYFGEQRFGREAGNLAQLLRRRQADRRGRCTRRTRTTQA